MMEPGSVAVFGLGLIGGSIARDLSAQGVRVLGYDKDTESLRQALDDGSVDLAIDATSDHLKEAEIVILAVPVDIATDLLISIAPRLEGARLVTDVGSTKTAIARIADECGLADRFIGSHPLCGDHRSGYSASRRGLFRDAKVFFCPPASASANAISLTEGLWARLGAHSISTAPEEHDHMMAWVSHLPQVTANALALALEQAGFARDDLGPGGLEMTRLAGSPPEVWSAILRENRDHAVSAITELIVQLERLRAQIAGADDQAIRDSLRHSRDWAMSHIPCKGDPDTRR